VRQCQGFVSADTAIHIGMLTVFAEVFYQLSRWPRNEQMNRQLECARSLRVEYRREGQHHAHTPVGGRRGDLQRIPEVGHRGEAGRGFVFAFVFAFGVGLAKWNEACAA